MMRRGLGDDRGSVVAEFAVALPAVALVLLLGAGSLGACARQVRLQDAAADAARLIARGEPEVRAWAVIASAVPGASSSADRRDELVCVTASSAAEFLPLALSATSCALDGGL
jgi:Flp pilus assembly protein TadG